MPELIWQEPGNPGRKVTRADYPSDTTRALLAQTIWGSRATRYRIIDIEAKLARLRVPSFFVLSEGDEELCVFVLDRCQKRVARQLCDGFHFVMASTVPHRQNEGLAGVLVDLVREYCVSAITPPGFGFAYVEETTEFSLRLSDQIGHDSEAHLPLTLFTRFFPRADPHATALRPDEGDTLRAALGTFYVDHQLTDFATSLKQDECFVIRDAGGKIVAAVQAEVLRWSVMSMPGIQGKFLLKVLPHLPGLNRLLVLQDLRIVRFSNLFISVGYENRCLALLEDCLYRHQARIGLFLLDERSRVLTQLRHIGRLGILSRATSGSAKLRLSTVGMDADMVAQLREGPVLMSAADVF
ncbi:hypothetical protein [Ovoidimarina sediminis]|uniref:hypothetical protein n=1 Tax=Ovoidimarina sediminis TaxID=3079856 RepID=UPI00290A1D2F|nr:hypothetical protein [Rhodophyticola sp. MJ-SS7]MDU8946234.1 hypothetical protein [Rhodophyticola sp. MJ-SS7]